MNTGSVIEFGALLALMLTCIGLLYGMYRHLRQSNVSVFMQYTNRYDEVMRSFPRNAFGVRLDSANALPEPSADLTLAVLRYLNLSSEQHYLYRDKYLSSDVWKIWNREIERTLKTPLFIREWMVLQKEFESYPEFVDYVNRIQSTRDIPEQPAALLASSS